MYSVNSFKRPSGKWKITDTKIEKHTKSNMDYLFIQLYLKRNGAIFSSYYAMPNIVMLCIGLSLFWLDARCSTRIVLIGLLWLCQGFVLQSMIFLVPVSGTEVPSIILMSSFSLILIVLHLITAILSRGMHSSLYNPSWLSTVTVFSVQNPVINKIFLFDMNPKSKAEVMEDEDESFLILKSKQVQNQWKIVSHVVNYSMFLMFLPISLCLCCVYFVKS